VARPTLLRKRGELVSSLMTVSLFRIVLPPRSRRLFQRRLDLRTREQIFRRKGFSVSKQFIFDPAMRVSVMTSVCQDRECMYVCNVQFRGSCSHRMHLPSQCIMLSPLLIDITERPINSTH
jgi:hypothetical protein